MQQLNQNRTTSKPALENGFQIFKKALGVSLIALSIYACISLLIYGFDTLNGEVSIQEIKILSQLIPKTSEARTIKISLPNSGSNPQLSSSVEVPEQLFLIPALFVILIILGLLIRVILAVLSAGISLVKDDVTYVFEKLREEMERKRIPINTSED